MWQLSQLPERVHQVIQFTWIAGLPFHMANGHLATFQADWGFLLDPLSSVMILVVTGIGFLIHVYSTGYMAHDNGYYRFFGYLNLFIFFMLMLVLANNYALLFVGWEGVGLCSYLLIGFYFHKKSAGDAGKKAFIVNRVGDAGFILGMLLMLSVLGTVRFTDVNAALRSGHFAPETAGFGVLSAMALLLFIGATGKSAQFPLYVWLPDAMEGPTPVSALIHAATMVTAGVYMVARSAALFQLTPSTSTIVASVGAFTAILAATIALVQNDIKRVLAYSTVSQLGYMFLALGVGAYWVAIFHLFTHAFFKALLFLCSGSVIHAMGGEQDMRHMGGLKNKIPITHWTMWVGSVAIAGIPGLAGFFSKDEILWQAYSSPQGSKLLWFVGLATAGLTAFYMWRLMNMTFYGKSRVKPEVAAHIHESPASMTVPLIAAGHRQRARRLAGHAAALWNLGESFRGFERWLEPAFASAAVGSRQGGRARRLHRMDPDGLLGGRRHHRHRGGALLLSPQAGDSRFARKAAQAAARPALQQVVRGRDLRFPVRQRPGQRRRPRAGRVRPQRGGWRRERRRLAHALHRHGLHVVGYLDRRWRGALQLLLREDALLPGLHPANRPRAGLRVLRGGRRAGVLRVLRGAVTIWTSTYSASSCSRRWPDWLVLLFIPVAAART